MGPYLVDISSGLVCYAPHGLNYSTPNQGESDFLKLARAAKISKAMKTLRFLKMLRAIRVVGVEEGPP